MPWRKPGAPAAAASGGRSLLQKDQIRILGEFFLKRSSDMFFDGLMVAGFYCPPLFFFRVILDNLKEA